MGNDQEHDQAEAATGATVLRLVTSSELEQADAHARAEFDHSEVAVVLAQAGEFIASTPTRGIMIVLTHDDGTHSHLSHAGYRHGHQLAGAMEIAKARLIRATDGD